MSRQVRADSQSERARKPRRFDTDLFRQPLSALPVQEPLVLGSGDTVTQAVRAMQREHIGCVLITDDGRQESKLVGIFTERDVLLRIIDRGKNPATLPMKDVMTPDPVVLPSSSTVAQALDKMGLGGFRHIPAVDAGGRPAFVVSAHTIVDFLVGLLPREVLGLPTQGPRPQRAG